MKLPAFAVAAGLTVAGVVHAQDAPFLIRRYDCYTCHADEEAKAGPAFVDVAAKYQGNSRGVAILTALVKNGRHGEGPWPMPPLPQVPDADARKIAEYILSLKK